jgi:hypothetical protein
MPFRMIDLTCSRYSFVTRFAFSSGRRGGPSGCDSSDAHKFVGINDPAVRGDPTVRDLDRADGVDPAVPVEHEGELAADQALPSDRLGPLCDPFRASRNPL